MCGCFFEMKNYSGALDIYFFETCEMSVLVSEIQFSSSSHLGIFENITLDLTLVRKRLVSSLNNPAEIKLL